MNRTTRFGPQDINVVYPECCRRCLCTPMLNTNCIESEKTIELEAYFSSAQTFWENVTDETRTDIWMSILNQEGKHSKATLNYYTLLEQDVPQRVLEEIGRDVGRTFPTSDLFTTGNGQESMNNILQAYAVYDAEVGYCQGMNFLVGLLLFFLPREDDAFGALVFLMHERGLRDFYTPEMSLLQVRLWQLNQLLPDTLLHHLESLGVPTVLFASPWFLTCFAASFPIQIASRILDVLFCDSLECFMLKFAYTILTSNLEHILALNDVEAILAFLRLDVPNWKISELHVLVTEAAKATWSDEHRSIFNSTNVTESVHDSILRIEEALSSKEIASTPCKEETPGRRSQFLKRSLPKITRFLSQIVIMNLKQLQFLYRSSPLQQLFQKLK